MKATVEIPDDLAEELESHARRAGRDAAEDLVHLVRLALLVDDLPLVDLQRFAALLRQLGDARHRVVHGLPRAPGGAVVSTDPATSLPVIISPPDAPIHSMKAEDVLALEQATLEEEDLERAGLPVRH